MSKPAEQDRTLESPKELLAQSENSGQTNSSAAANSAVETAAKPTVKEMKAEFTKVALIELKNHAVPLILLVLLLFFPALMLVWVPLVLGFWAIEAIYERLGPAKQKRIQQLLPEKWRNSAVTAEILEGMAQVRPFILASLYIFCIPFALVWMYIHWIFKLNKSEDKDSKQALITNERLCFLQNRKADDEQEEVNFFHSPAFAISATVLFVSGLPAALTYLLYQQLGIDALFGFPSLDPRFKTIFVVIGLYLGSVACCGSVLFFRSWFTFPLNFLDNQETIELNPGGIKRKNQSWFMQVLTFNSPWKGAQSLNWSDVKTLCLDKSTAPLYPLPPEAFGKNSIIYYLLNQMALLFDGLQKNRNREKFIYFTSAASDRKRSNFRDGKFGRSIRIKLSELSGSQRAQLCYAVKNWAPHVEIEDSAQAELTGTNILQAPAYTQLWFELLTDKMPGRSSHILAPGTELDQKRLTVEERIASGGQANVYLARDENQNLCVLKEFILSNSEAVGALLESAGEFEMEASLLSELKHPRIVKMLRFFAEARRLYIVLEHLDGQSLRRIIKSQNRAFSQKETIEIAIQVCEVLAYLHEQKPPVVHRDISPDNLILCSDGIKLVDFSLAAAQKTRRTSSTMGKHSYAPPEQFREQPCPQSDIYGLGATMYYMLTAEDPRPLSPDDPEKKLPMLSERLKSILKESTAFELDERTPSALWMKTELETARKEITQS